ncbi:carboxymuconolactone decarboxylase family protein [Pseudonocardia sp. MCCB 268]|nr:carboxymuconolactone decarboxylase family protein [Pseudonocardia cytotoxica]
MTNPVMVPDAMTGLLCSSARRPPPPPSASTHHLLHLRVSQINGCSLCIGRNARAREIKAGRRTRRNGSGPSAPGESRHFSDAERAALELAERVTQLTDGSDQVPDDVWNAAADIYDEKELASLLVSIAAFNAWNRLQRGHPAAGSGSAG